MKLYMFIGSNRKKKLKTHENFLPNNYFVLEIILTAILVPPL